MKKLIKAKGALADWQDNALLALEAMGFERLTYNIIRTEFTGEKDGTAFGLKIEASDDGKVALHLDGDDAQIANFKKLAAAAFQLKAKNAQKAVKADKVDNKDGLPTPGAPVEKADDKADKNKKTPDNKPDAAPQQIAAAQVDNKQAKKTAKAQKAKKPKRGLTFGWGLLIFIIVLFGAMALYGWHVGLFDKMMHRGQTPKKKVVRQQEEAYTKVDMQTLVDAFYNDFNACSQTYTNKRVEVTGYIQKVDTYGSNFTVTVQNPTRGAVLDCTVHSNDMRDQVKQLQPGNAVTVRGTISQVGDTFGFSMDEVDSVTKTQ